MKHRKFKLRDKDAEPGFVYFWGDDWPGPLKIGFTFDLHSRGAQLKSAHPGDEYDFKFWFYTRRISEKIIHNRFKDCRINREWFDQNKFDLNEFMDDVFDFQFAINISANGKMNPDKWCNETLIAPETVFYICETYEKTWEDADYRQVLENECQARL